MLFLSRLFSEPAFLFDGIEGGKMYFLKTEQSFDSAHFLAGYHGKCANIHGHRWKVIATIKSEKLLEDPQNKGMVTDFGDLKKDLKIIADSFDHALIIETGSLSEKLYQALIDENFKIINLPFRPTAENLAKYIYEALSKNYLVDCLDVYETPKVVEKFISINGEGSRAGQLAAFIRFHYCNLNCSYCDTRYANDSNSNYELLSAQNILDYLKANKVVNVTLTGGEPLLQQNIDYLIDLLLKNGFSVEIETNGSIDIKPFIKETRPIFTLDYKVPSSTMENEMCLNNYQYLTKNDVVKFVVSNLSDLNKAKEIIDTYDLVNRTKVYFSPVFGKIEPRRIVDYMVKHHLNGINMQLQMHKFIWDINQRGV